MADQRAALLHPDGIPAMVASMTAKRALLILCARIGYTPH
jgi:hypothetical protein